MRNTFFLRDISFILAVPIIAVLVSIAAIASGERILRQGGLDVDFAMKDHLAIAADFCRIALVCFAAGLLSFLLPKKKADAEQSSSSR